jgi:AcrR family transcriptional regulator
MFQPRHRCEREVWMPGDSGIRVRARQARSVATFERILESAGSLFDEVGVDATTMEAIAERAGVSIGSVYRFFANKSALKATLVARWEERIRAVLEPPSGIDPSGIDPSVDRFVAVLRQVLADMPGARALLATTLREPPGETRQWTSYLERYLMRYAPGLSPERRTAAAHAYMTITVALILAAVDAGPALDQMLDEVHTVLAGYTRELARLSAAAAGGDPPPA